jgi:energy-coupling factor transporter ATP-binding protein EcfA2
VQLGYVDQSRDSLDGSKTVWEEISGGKRPAHARQARGELARLCLGVQLQGRRPAEEGGRALGGERNRVHLAKMLKSGANVLLLDEPTNDLDVDTLRALEEALEDFAGCAVIISHDRWFLDRIATHMLAFEGESHVEWFEGNFQDYEADKTRRLGVDAGVPHRIKYQEVCALTALREPGVPPPKRLDSTLPARVSSPDNIRRPCGVKGAGLAGRTTSWWRSRTRVRPRVLAIDDWVPDPRIGAARRARCRCLRAIIAAGSPLTLLPTLKDPIEQSDPQALLPRAEIALGFGIKGIADFLRERADDFDVVVVSRPHNMAAFRAAARPETLAATVYDAEALFAVRDACNAT